MYIPLAERMRPKNLAEVVGQEHLLEEGGIIKSSMEKKRPFSLLLWGPPGSGKTTLAKLYASYFDAKLISISAVTSGVADLKKIISEIEGSPLLHRMTFIFLDEIHRWNKSQQDLLLPYIEKGTFLLIGATTENPSFSLNDALLSRLRVLKLNFLSEDDLKKLLGRYEEEIGMLPLTDEGRGFLIHNANGDGRYLYNMIEAVQDINQKELFSIEELEKLLSRRAPLFDRAGDGHYDLISALHKSVRGSDPDASLYWFCRMLEGGEQPLFIARRMIRMASEDIGLADPDALKLAMAAKDAYEMLGSPEGELALAECVLYLALAPKSNAIYTAYNEARAIARETNHFPPPKIILNAPTKLMKKEGYGKGYQYDHDTPKKFSGQNYFPDDLERQKFYRPNELGFEREMSKRLRYFEALRKDLNPNDD